MLKVAGISKKFKNVTALDNIDLAFGDKGLVAVLGESGSGKSTLFNILAGIVKPDSGRVLYDGIPLNEDGQINSQNVFGIIFQDGNLFGGLTVKQNLDICLKDTQRQNEILQDLGIKKYINTNVGKLSGGEMQRVAIARALLADSKILLADEPTGSLDEKNGENVMSILKDISRQKLVIVITHNTEFAERYADRIIKIHKGIVKSDTLNLTSIINECKENQQAKKVNDLDFREVKNSRHELSCGVLSKFCLNKLKNTFVKSFTSIIIFSVLVAIVAISSAFLMADCRKEYIKSLQKYEVTQLFDDYDMRVFEQKLKDGDMNGLTRFYYYAWVEGMCNKIIVDDSLADDQIKFGYYTWQVVNNNYDNKLKVGDSIDYNGRQFSLVGFVDHIDSSYLLEADRAVYLNDKVARDIILNSEFKINLTHINNEVNVVCDNTLSEGECIIDFGLYYHLASYDALYIDLAKKYVEWHIERSGTTLYKKQYKIISVDQTEQNASVCTLYVSQEDFDEINNSRLFYGYMLDTDNNDVIEYWWDRGVDVYDIGFNDYQYHKELQQNATPYIGTSLAIGIILSALYMLTILNHIVSANVREMYILKALSVGNKSIFGILLLQALPVVLCGNIIAFAVNIAVKTLIAKKFMFLVLASITSSIILLLLSIVMILIVTAIKVAMLNKKFDINLTR